MRRLAFVALALPVALVAQTPDPSRIEHMLRGRIRLTNEPDSAFSIQERMQRYHIPGLSLAVIDNFKVVFAKGYGVEEFGTTRAVDSTTVFQAGSISKPVFGSGLMALVQQGKLSLDEDVNRYLKSWKMPASRFTEGKAITLRKLMTHTAGLTVWGFPGYELGKPVATVQQVLDGTSPANTPAVRNDTFPGAFWRYSGGGITIAQLVTTDLTGEPFPALMNRLVLAPAGMKHSTYEQQPLPAPLAAHMASGHERMDTPVPGRAHIYPEMAAAGLWTTASDLGRWAIAMSRAYRGEPGGLLPAEAAKVMLSAQVDVQPPYRDARNPNWGIGVSLGGEGEDFHFTHNGRDEGFIASLIMWPQSGRGVAIMANGVNGQIMEEINRAFGELYGLNNGMRIDRRAVPMDSVALIPFAGTYRLTGPNGNQIFDVTASSRGLLVKPRNAPQPRVFLSAGNDTFFDRESPQQFTFDRDPSTGVAKAMWFMQGGSKVTFTREP
jgi:CubicO group peptidase (beta-lactamase class C family)